MDTAKLAQLVASSHDAHYGATSLAERLRDLQREVDEIAGHRDRSNLVEEIGDAGWSLLQLCNEQGVDFSQAVLATVRKLDARAVGKRIALIGTSANPITNAHLTMGLEMLALTDVDDVWYVVTGEHPWGKKLMPSEHRLEMVRRATTRYPHLHACDFEVRHGAEIYGTTRETAEILRDYLLPAYPECEFAWVMGSDVAQSFHFWRGAEWMAEHLRIFIIHRLGYDFDKEGSLLADPKHLYLREDIVTSNISSTLVRKRGRGYDQAKLMALVPDVVWDYLSEHRLLDPEVLG